MNVQQRIRFAWVRTASIAMLGAVLVAPCAAEGVRGDEPQLGEAPRLDVPQDASGARQLPTSKAARGAPNVRALAASVQTRASVAQIYSTVYVPGSAVTLNWTGDVPSCAPGTTNLEHRQAVIDRINYARTLAGLPPVTLLDGLPTTQAQSAALMMLANGALSHAPPMSWLCYSTDGFDGAGRSNISIGVNGVNAVDLYLDDTGAGNAAVGHRRWILYPPQVAMATGDVFRAASQPFPAANSLYVLGSFGARPATPGGVAWPPAGFVPYQNLPVKSKRWSFSYSGADFTGATVTMTGPNGPIPVTFEALATGYGDNTIVFLPVGVSYANPGTDATYTIIVSGMTGSGVPSSIQYTVTVIDPLAMAPTPTANYQGLWYNAPAESEAGWGINFAHQGDIIFGTWFTYDATGKALWLSMTASKTAEGVYSGTLYETRGPAFSATPFGPATVTVTPVGVGTLTFGNGNNGRFAYVVNGIAQTKTITRQVFGPLPTCTFGAQPDLALATNYQDLWYAAPAESEAGWGVNFTHQGDIIFATWFTYDTDGTPLWLSATATRTATGVYTGTLYRTTGPAFNAVPFLPANVVLMPVGTLTLTFANGNSASFAYTVNGVAQTKSIVRQVFRTPGTVCQ